MGVGHAGHMHDTTTHRQQPHATVESSRIYKLAKESHNMRRQGATTSLMPKGRRHGGKGGGGTGAKGASGPRESPTHATYWYDEPRRPAVDLVLLRDAIRGLGQEDVRAHHLLNVIDAE